MARMAFVFLWISAFAFADAGFSKLVDSYFDDYFAFRPERGTAAGLHQYDNQLTDLSRAAIDKRLATLKAHLKKFQAFPRKKLPQALDIDWEILTHAIQAEILDLETIRFWERDPDRYSAGATEAVYGLMSRTYATPEARLKAVVAREKLLPRHFQTARENLRNPPRIYTEIALEQIPGIVSFFEKDLPSAFADVKDEALRKEFAAANAAVLSELKAYGVWLKRDLLPRSLGDFRIGTANFAAKLKYEEMVEIPLSRLLEIGYADLRKNQKAFQETAAKWMPGKPYQEALKALERDHPPPAKLLEEVHAVTARLKKFVTEKKIVTIPSPVDPIIQETPPFLRALTFASMDTPGPFEKEATEAYYNVTLPEATWRKNQVEEYMAGFNHAVILSTSVHEAYPGHYTQFLWVQRAPTKTRKLLGANSNSEGWAHYTEQMMLDEGYGDGDPKLRLGQLQDALLRNARFVVGLEMHRGNMTFEQGIDFFVKEGYTSRANGERETKRGTSDPTYLYYTLGKLQILKLREDYRVKQGEKFSLQDFHDRLLGEGFPPVKLLRRALLGDGDSAVL